jgi:hypothetical protein
MKSKPLYPRDPPETPDPRDLQEHHAPELELQLLRHGIVDMAADRMRCSRCGRSPLVGERLHVFAAAPEDQHICDLCLEQARKGRLGEPKRVERVGAGERRLIVRPAA